MQHSKIIDIYQSIRCHMEQTVSFAATVERTSRLTVAKIIYSRRFHQGKDRLLGLSGGSNKGQMIGRVLFPEIQQHVVQTLLWWPSIATKFVFPVFHSRHCMFRIISTLKLLRLRQHEMNMKMEAICFSETYDFHLTTRHCIPEDGSLHGHLCENLMPAT
jgi:hypothetical protein